MGTDEEVCDKEERVRGVLDGVYQVTVCRDWESIEGEKYIVYMTVGELGLGFIELAQNC